MTGLNLDPFLQLIRADLGAWASLGLVVLILAVMTWTSWGSRRALRKCLFLSIAVHVGLIAYGSSSPVVLRIFRLSEAEFPPPPPVEQVKVMPWAEKARPEQETGPDGRPARNVSVFDQDRGPLALADPGRLASTANLPAVPTPSRAEPVTSTPEPVAPGVEAPAPPAIEAPKPAESKGPEAPPSVEPGDPSEVAPVPVDSAPIPGAVPTIPGLADLRSRPRPAVDGPAPFSPRPGDLGPLAALTPATPNPPPVDSTPMPGPPRASVVPKATEDSPVAAQPDSEPLPPAPSVAISPNPTVDVLPGPEIRRAPRPARPSDSSPSLAIPRRQADDSAPPAMARATPTGPSELPSTPRPVGRRSLAEVPAVYRSRLDPNRASLAQRAGASLASEQAVERALDWLARHQDADGRWDGGTARLKDGSIYRDDDSFTIHCPAGEVCFGECFYWEADTALTGLSLLAYLGSGYTHLDGKYASTVAKGLEFLARSQKQDGDLRGPSLAVGMYCHSMATLALCEAYALTGDARLRGPVERAVGFLVRARSADGLAWRYSPGAPDSDTSILGWAVMALKSAKTVGIPIPPSTQEGVLGWLKKVSQGRDGGLAFYSFEPNGKKVTPTMTAEAWACRQFLEVGGPGRASDEAAAFLVQNPTDGGGEFNIYYLYYGTLAMFQHGGEPWSSWNGRVRDQVVSRQHREGHKAGSWDPDDSRYGSKGGRIYGTALATLTLEVYYRFFRLYEPAAAGPRPLDGGARRAGMGPAGR